MCDSWQYPDLCPLPFQNEYQVVQSCVKDWTSLANAAQQQGFRLQAVSAWRSPERQLEIWNRKAQGLQTVLSPTGQPLDISKLTEEQLMWAILFWSALPGTSRHHWGCDIDVIDAQAVPSGYQVELIPAEVDDLGMFGPFHLWLDQRIEQHQAFGFFRPFIPGQGSVQPERWHLSHAPSAQLAEKQFNPDQLKQWLSSQNLALKEVVLDHLDQILEQYVYAYFQI